MGVRKGDRVNLYLRERLDAEFNGTVSEMGTLGITLRRVKIRHNDVGGKLEFYFPWTSVAYVAKEYE